MQKRKSILPIVLLMVLFSTGLQGAETTRTYENRFKVMLDYAIRINEYVRLHLGDRKLCAYAQQMTKTNAREAEQMSPPKKYTELHPHFLLVLENVERSFYYAAEQRLERYRHHQKIVRKELHILEALADRAGIEPYEYRY